MNFKNLQNLAISEAADDTTFSDVPGDMLRKLAADNGRLRQEVARLEAQNKRLARMSETDALTGLPNQRAFRNVLRREMKRARRSDTDVSLVIFDVDDFKATNDQYGHAVGDAILARVATVMGSAVRESDVLTRYGGEEFALIAPGTGLQGARLVAEKVRLAVSSHSFSVIGLDDPASVHVTVSAGVACLDTDEQLLFADADRALYRAKDVGKDCVVLSR